MNLWNGLKFSLGAALACCVIGAGTVAHAIPLLVANGTYVFEAIAGQPTYANGSTVTFSNDNLTAWDLLDPSDNSTEGFPLTQSNSYITINNTYSGAGLGTSAGVYGTNDWAFNILGNNYPSETYSYAEIGNNTTFTPANGLVFSGNNDPYGVWTLDPAPDVTGTLALVAGAFALLGIFRVLAGKRPTAVS